MIILTPPMILHALKPVQQYGQLEGITMEMGNLYSHMQLFAQSQILLGVVFITMMVVVILSLINTTWLPLNTWIVTVYLLPGSRPITVRGLSPFLVIIVVLQLPRQDLIALTWIWWDESHDTLMVPTLGDVTSQFWRMQVSVKKH